MVSVTYDYKYSAVKNGDTGWIKTRGIEKQTEVGRRHECITGCVM